MTLTQNPHNRRPNSLIHSKSPYLLQHAYNPVDWYQWGEEAFEKAKKEDKPIFLSIGYSTCHWCHVMERESFEDEEVAVLLKEHYIAVKVDREERPDVDHIYMTVCQSMTGQGGWPLTAILTPEKKPFFVGTYYPKHSKHGRPGLMDILTVIQEKWQNDRPSLEKIGTKSAERLQKDVSARSHDELRAEALREGYQWLKHQFDKRYGGFGHAPKFPTPQNLTFLLRYWKYGREKEALDMVEKTLQSMHAGGIYDHLGYGFSRYSTDDKWLVPHFEKMLYDNALLAIAYLECYQATGKEEYAQVARDIFSYVLRDMTDRKGGFYSAEDADSEGVEGKFYVWTPQEIKEALGNEMGELFCQYYGVTEKGNFEGYNILNRVYANQVPFSHPYSEEDWKEKLFEAQQTLWALREKRVHPYKDDKILTSWNGMMIAALAMGARVLQDSQYLSAAEKAFQFIWDNLRNENGRLLARYRDGEAAHLGYLDDYACLIWSLLELYHSSKKSDYLLKAINLQKEQTKLFWDTEDSGFYFYGSDAEELLARPKEIYDGATPSGNSVSALNLLRLARLTGDTAWEEQALDLLNAFSAQISALPAGHSYSLMALFFSFTPNNEIVVVADKDIEEVRESLKSLEQQFLPETVFLYRFAGAEYKGLEDVAPFVRDMKPLNHNLTFYVCRDFACQQPTTNMEEVKEFLELH
ncbi:thioredoxin domain-containing protein [Heliorestis acidaminivorans]|uniref:Thioredoxin domain-containing protein n=1 Tax=Heliorestis acidaminivorans TaxID=553427 RepID=A0A6I0EVI2_9FIRM|nr:thioredoxin domain-containing protein [Heliorestis acidaminivorans]KAB2951928.1 thioredoxin domain-containing protein [Heliorestis acidaminivorans]